MRKERVLLVKSNKTLDLLHTFKNIKMFLKIICIYEKCSFICQLFANVMFSVKSLCLLLFFLSFFCPVKIYHLGPGQFCPHDQKCSYRTRSILPYLHKMYLLFLFFVQKKAEKEFDPSSDSSGKEWQTREGGPCGHEPRNILFEHR